MPFLYHSFQNWPRHHITQYDLITQQQPHNDNNFVSVDISLASIRQRNAPKESQEKREDETNSFIFPTSPSPSVPPLSTTVPTVVDTDTLLQNHNTIDTIQQPLPKKSKLLLSHTAINHAPSLPTLSEQTEVNVAVDGTSIAIPSSSVPGSTNSTPGKTKQKNTHTARNVPSTPISL
jgi:hypothetical protein